MSETFLQSYGWVIVSILGGLLAVLMFVLGANLHLGSFQLDTLRKRAVLKAAGRKWLFAVLALVAFGGVVYAAFPLFFRVLFYGARRLWELILLALVIQLAAYLVNNKADKMLGSNYVCFFLMLIGFLAPLLVGTLLGTFFIGAGFSVDQAASPALVAWDSPWHGLELLAHPQALLLGLIYVCLSFLLSALYVIRVVDDHAVRKQMRRSINIMTVPFLVLSIVWVLLLLLRPGFSVNSDGVVSMDSYKYLMTILHDRPVQAVLLVGILLFAGGLYFGVFTKSRRKGFWFTAAGSVIVVMGLFFLAGFNETAYFPSLTDIQSSLTIPNSSADLETLEVLSWVSPVLPVTLLGLGYAWHRVDHKKKITVRRLLHQGKVH